ncbi:MAG: hypothetical protein ACI8P3_001792 [Saprospiraceae bacterium]|jgi:hypothetical protein
MTKPNKKNRAIRFTWNLKLYQYCLPIFLLPFFISCTEKTEKQKQSAPEAEQLFVLTDSSETGFYFLNEVNETEEVNIFTYLNLYNGSGVAIGDINNDGLPDIFMGGNLFGGRLYLNKGNFKFQQISETANVFYPGFTTGITMVDVNEDGYLDIYLCRSLQGDPEKRTNLLLINNQDLTFTEQARKFGIDDSGYSIHANFFDMDNDGDLDLYVLNHRVDFDKQNYIMPYLQKLNKIKKTSEEDYKAFSNHLYRNEGNGNFTDITRQAGLQNEVFSLAATVADLNSDGYQDIFLSCDFADKDHLYINNQDGTFTDKVDSMLAHISRSSMGSDIADVNNDGLLDIMVVDMMAEDHFRQKQMGFGQVSYDMFHLAADYGLNYQISRNCLQLNNGNGTFSEIAQLAGVSNTDWSWSPLIADFDNDGLKDIFVSNGYPKDVNDTDFVHYLSDSLARHKKMDNALSFRLSQSIQSTALPNYIFQNSGNLIFHNRSQDWGLTQKTFSNGAAYADLDLDGDLDLIVNNYNQPALLYRNRSRELISDHHYISIALKGGQGNTQALGAKVWVEAGGISQFQEVTTNRGFLSSSGSTLHFGLGNEEEVDRIEVLFPNGKTSKLENIQADQCLQIDIKQATDKKTERSSTKPLLTSIPDLTSPPYQHRESQFIDFKVEPLLDQMYSNRGPFLAVGDVNNDGLDDFYVGGSAGFPGELYMQDKVGRFQKKETSAFQKDAKYEDGQSLFFDAENDGDLDLFVTSGSNEQRDKNLFQNRLYLNDGFGNFILATGQLPVNYNNTICLESIDIDADGDTDLFIGGHVQEKSFPMAYKSYFLINENGNFKAVSILPKEGKLGIVNDASSLDINNDGLPDLLLAGEWMDITLLINKGGRFEDETSQYGLEHTAGLWYCLETLDIDNDGDLDFVAGNRGTNTYFQVSESKPAVLLAKDFDDNGQLDAFTSHYYNDGLLHPKHSLDDLLKQVVSLKKKFSKYHPYSTATTEDLFTIQEMKGVKRREVFTYESSFFINNGKEGFTRHPLPIEAQFSHVMGILSTDINQDGTNDLLLAGNNLGVNVVAGRDDASIGICLQGDNGEFKTIPLSQSGFFVPGEARQIGLLKSINEKKIIIALRNNSFIQAFQKAD